ncbi:hypothetical protein BCR34DRAFT_477808 [Clohesyomyces aquaticus]|uniref:Uncharacterized protein n=1 Tax=Clohesyomyces aquaticus TaxID=1231657 RepID=A0A1Y1ZYU9_9PLEO|nr:hypothetical protein BCR34DRAFT_477808 [Clohesyomyces aquaticus]
MSAPAAVSSASDIFASLEHYNWDDDFEFQSGLSAILGSNSSPEQATELTLRARCFYYSRKYHTNIDFDAYKDYRNSRPSRPVVPPPDGVQAQSQSLPAGPEPSGGILPTSATTPEEPPAPYPTSFAHIVELVTTGQPIPGIKEIPPTLLSGQESQPVKAKRKKPWETDDPVSA